MAIANSILKKFVELTTDPDPEVGYYVYGTAIVNENGKYVQVDGSDSVTSVSLATDLVTGDRVLVYIEGHKASVIGNVTCPASGRTAVDVSNMLEDFSSLVVGALYATYAEIESIRANYVTTEYLEATYATITDLQVVFESVDYLYAGVANIETLLGGEGGFGTLESIHLTVDNAVIDELVVTNAIANNAILGTLLAGVIYTDYITIESLDGSIEIIGTTMQFTDEDGNVRLQIGKDASGNFTFILYDADGVGIMLDSEGIHESAVPDGLIVDDMVADNAAIRGDKIDMKTLTYCLNEYGELELDASRVLIDGSTLDYQLTRINQSIDGILLEGVKDWKLYFAKNASNKSNPNDSPTLQFSSEALVFSGGDNKTGTLTINVACKEGLTPVGIVSYSEDIEGPLRLIEGPDLNGDVVTAIYENVYENVYGTVVLTIVIEYEYEDELVLWSLEEPELNTGEYLWARYWMEKMDDSIEWGIPFLFTDSETRNATTTLQTELKVVQGQIEAYIYETETAIDELKQSISETWTVIQENLGEILETVGEMQTTLYEDGVGLVSRMSTVELTTNSINESVSSVESWLGDYYSYTESLNTVINQTVEDAKADIMLDVSYEYSGTLKGLENYYAISGSLDIAPPDEAIVATLYEHFSNIDESNLTAEIIRFSIEASLSGFGYGDINPIRIVSCEVIVDGKTIDVVETIINGSTIEITIASENISLKSDLEVTVVAEYTTEWSTEYPHVGEGEYLWVRQLITHTDKTTEWGTPWCVSDDVSGFASIAYTNAQIELSASQTEASIMSQAESLFVTADGWFKTTSDIYQYVNDQIAEIELKVVMADEFDDVIADLKIYVNDSISDITLEVSNTRDAFDKEIKETTASIETYVDEAISDIKLEVSYTLTEFEEGFESEIVKSTTALIEAYVDELTASLSLSVSGALGETASIMLTTDGSTLSTAKLDLTEVRKAFANDKTAISISSGTITLVSGILIIESGRFRLDENGNLYIDTNQFTLDYDGNATFSGMLKAPRGEIGGFTIDDNSLYNKNHSSFSSTSFGVYIGDDGISLGSGFSVNASGYLEAKSGEIGGWYIGTNSLYNGTDSMSSTTNGTYLGSQSGIRQYSGGNYINITGSVLTNGNSSDDRAVLSDAQVQYYYHGDHVGNIGTNCYVNNNKQKGLVFDLDYVNGYMAWAVKFNSGASTYTSVLAYTNGTSVLGYNYYGFHFGDYVWMHGYPFDAPNVSNAIANGYNTIAQSGTQTFQYISGIKDNGDGTISWTCRTMQVASGLIISY